MRDAYCQGNIIFNKVASTDVTFRDTFIDTGNGVVNVYGQSNWDGSYGLNSVTFSDGVTYNQEEINSIRWNSRS